MEIPNLKNQGDKDLGDYLVKWQEAARRSSLAKNVRPKNNRRLLLFFTVKFPAVM